jgi:U2-associated protein SR140
MKSLAGVVKKKSPFEKHKEEQEAKKKVVKSTKTQFCDPSDQLYYCLQKQEDEAAKAYQEFVESFQEDEKKNKNFFVKGETFLPPNSIAASPVPTPAPTAKLAAKTSIPISKSKFSLVAPNNVFGSAKSEVKSEEFKVSMFNKVELITHLAILAPKT